MIPFYQKILYNYNTGDKYERQTKNDRTSNLTN